MDLHRRLLIIIFIVCLGIGLSGCGETYPKAKLTESLVNLCKKEHNLDVKVEVHGNTLAVFMPVSNLWDISFSISKEAIEKINDVVTSASRVALSTDAGIKFICIIVQDFRLPEIQIVMMEYLEDIKMYQAECISREERIKRSLMNKNLNPQALKEGRIVEIFKAQNISADKAEEILNDFFRAKPVFLRDFGYWQDKFYIKEITLPEFLAEQMVYRVKVRFLTDTALAEKYMYRDCEAGYAKEGAKYIFYFDFDILPDEVLVALDEKPDPSEIFKNVLLEISDCLYGYGFKDFSEVRIRNLNSEKILTVTKDEIFDFKNKKIGIDSIISK